MTPAARLQATLDLLTEVETTPRPADAVASAYFRARRYIGSKDRAAVATLVYTLLRHHARLGWWLAKYQTEATPRSRLLVWLTLGEAYEPTVIDQLFSGGRFAPPALAASELTLLNNFKGHTLIAPAMPEEVRGECPDWAAPALKARFGKSFMKEMEALLQPAPLDLRVNALKVQREAMLAAFKKLGLKAEACPYAPFGIRVLERPSLAELPMLKNGEVEIQDEGSQLVALLVDAKPGQRVVDFCAGAGGKTLAIAAQMNNKGRITACDVLEKRLKRSTERFRRAGVHNIETKPLTSETDQWVKRHKDSFDRVLVDAPCSGTGTWRRNPDARWRSLGPGLTALLPLQASILNSAARLVKPGGRLIYATCSLLDQENGDQVAAFLAAHDQFRLAPYHEIAGMPGVSAHPDYLSLTPARHGTDGFFAAVMERLPRLS